MSELTSLSINVTTNAARAAAELLALKNAALTAAQASLDAANAAIAEARANGTLTGALAATLRAEQANAAAALRSAQASQAQAAASSAAAEALRRQAAAAAAAAEAARRLTANQGRLSAQTGNIGAQFQDIGVQLAGGQSPWLIALQQGTQLSAVLNTVSGGARGVGAALGAAFASILSPVSLATIAIIGLGGTAIQYFTSVDRESEKANAAIKKQTDFVKTLAETWGETIPAFQAYYDELERAQSAQDLKTGKQIVEDSVWKKANSELDELYPKMQDAQAILENLGKSADFKQVITQFSDLQDKVAKHNATVAEANSVAKSLNDAYDKTGVRVFKDAAKYATDLANQISKVTAQMSDLKIQFNDVASRTTDKVGDTGQSGFIDNSGIYRTRREFMPYGDIPTPEKRPPVELEGLEKKRPGGGPDSAIDKQVEAYQKLIQSQQEQAQNLQLEASLIGASVKERNEQTAALRAEQELRRNGIDLLSKEGQAYKQNAIDQADAKTQIEARSAAVKSWQDAESSAVDSIVDGISTVNNDWKATFAGILQDMEKFILTLTISNPIKNWLTGSNLPTMSDLFSGKSPSVPGATTTGTMTVTAASVMVNGGVPGLPGVTQPSESVSTFGKFLGLGENKTSNNAPTLKADGLINLPPDQRPLVNNAATPSSMIAYQNAIKSIESGGRYDITGPVLKSGDRAYGAYQVMGNNIPSWSEKWTGTKMTPQQYLADPSAQDKVFNGEFGSYVDKYGPSGAASKWFTGSAIPTGKKDVLGTSDNQYVKQFNAALEKTTPNVSDLGATSTKTATDITSSLGKLAQPNALPAAAVPSTGGGSVGGFGSIFSSIFSLFGFASGGYTGAGHPNAVAGFAHKGEYVFDAKATKAWGVGNLENMRRGYVPARRENIPAARNDNRSAGVNGKISASIRYVEDGTFAAQIDSIKQEAISASDARTDAKMRAYDEEHLPVRMQQISNNPYARG